MVVEIINGEKMIIFSKVADQLQRGAWREVEKNKYLLRTKIEEFEGKIKALYNQERTILE